MGKQKKEDADSPFIHPSPFHDNIIRGYIRQSFLEMVYAP
jgi:hypothetical protein